ncbi:MAG: GNAT family N-acetyltransferase [Sphingomonas sp.]
MTAAEPSSIQIAPLAPDDRREWEALARGYKAFYRDPTPDAVYDAVWDRVMTGEPVRGLGARLDGRLLGIVHFLFHAHSWHGEVCYLQDLFTAPEARGRGIARALIHAVGETARARKAAALYWLTKDSNEGARLLYDRLARNKGFIRYDYPL